MGISSKEGWRALSVSRGRTVPEKFVKVDMVGFEVVQPRDAERVLWREVIWERDRLRVSDCIGHLLPYRLGSSTGRLTLIEPRYIQTKGRSPLGKLLQDRT